MAKLLSTGSMVTGVGGGLTASGMARVTAAAATGPRLIAIALPQMCRTLAMVATFHG